jgi:potassium-transporting ATPase potassium-binding subunit
MNWQGWAQIAVFAALVTVVVKPLGGYIMRNVDGEGPEQRVFAPLECGLYRLAGVDPAEEQGWVQYALALLWFHLAGIAMLYALLRLQNLLPLNPQQMDAMTPDLALNTAVGFATNTSWPSYGGETTLSYLSQMAGIVVQSFMSAAIGVAVALALVRGFARRSEGNEVKMTMLALLCVPAAILCIAAVAAVLPAGVGALNNVGPHGFSELLYTYYKTDGCFGTKEYV